MAKAVLISIQPQWCELIASGKKTLEVRKTMPKLGTPFKCYIYCTNTKPFLVWGDVFRGNWETEFTSIYGYSREEAEKIWDVFNGKVIGEFVCDSIECFGVPYPAFQKELDKHILDESCCSYYQLHRYAYHDALYGWHISDLIIYEAPKGLDWFRKPIECHRGIQRENCKGCWDCEIKRPPQSWCYVEELK